MEERLEALAEHLSLDQLEGLRRLVGQKNPRDEYLDMVEEMLEAENQTLMWGDLEDATGMNSTPLSNRLEDLQRIMLVQNLGDRNGYRLLKDSPESAITEDLAKVGLQLSERARSSIPEAEVRPFSIDGAVVLWHDPTFQGLDNRGIVVEHFWDRSPVPEEWHRHIETYKDKIELPPEADLTKYSVRNLKAPLSDSGEKLVLELEAGWTFKDQLALEEWYNSEDVIKEAFRSGQRSFVKPPFIGSSAVHVAVVTNEVQADERRILVLQRDPVQVHYHGNHYSVSGEEQMLAPGEEPAREGRIRIADQTPHDTAIRYLTEEMGLPRAEIDKGMVRFPAVFREVSHLYTDFLGIAEVPFTFEEIYNYWVTAEDMREHEPLPYKSLRDLSIRIDEGEPDSVDEIVRHLVGPRSDQIDKCWKGCTRSHYHPTARLRLLFIALRYFGLPRVLDSIRKQNS